MFILMLWTDFLCPNISIGIPVLKSVRKMTEMFLDVHLMIDKPVRYAKAFCDAGADLVMFHVEADSYQNISDAIDIVKENGKKVGLCAQAEDSCERTVPVYRSTQYGCWS